MSEMKKFAVLIDADNTSHKNIEVILQEIAKYGIASVKRIYGDWSSENLQIWQDKLLPNAITPVQQFAYVKGKDATDMKLVIDAMDLLYAGELDGFCIISSDSDFTPLASRIRESGRLAYGFGERKTPSSFISACDKFIYVENLIELNEEEEDSKNTTPKNSNDINDKTTPYSATDEENSPIDNIEKEVLQLIYKAIEENADDNGWANLSAVGTYINSVKSDFDTRTYGSATLSKLLKKLVVFEVKNTNNRGFVKTFGFAKFLKYIDTTLIEIDKNNSGISISKLIETIIKDKQSHYHNFTVHDLENKIKAINSKYFELSSDKNTIKRVIE